MTDTHKFLILMRNIELCQMLVKGAIVGCGKVLASDDDTEQQFDSDREGLSLRDLRRALLSKDRNVAAVDCIQYSLTLGGIGNRSRPLEVLVEGASRQHRN